MTRSWSMDSGWDFRLCQPGAAWETVELPHVPFTPDLDGRKHWFGLCEYRRTITRRGAPGDAEVLWIGAAMHTLHVHIDDREVACHAGGYLPFEIDLTQWLDDGAPHELCLVLDNRDAPDVPPGKAFEELDFCWFGGLYREVEWRVYPRVFIPDPVSGRGGILFRTEQLTPERARCRVTVGLANRAAEVESHVTTSLLFEGRVVAQASSVLHLPARGEAAADFTLEVDAPRPWCVSSPALHLLHVMVRDVEGSVLDERVERVGIRRIHFSMTEGFCLNGVKVRLRGTNRHQEYPYVGHAAGRAAQHRDARRIKEAGFDYVRLSHYPQSPHFLDACDELGLVVMNAIPGWQYLGVARFQEACFQNAREVIRRDRNHPCVVLWELSLNETEMPDAFMDTLHRIGHEELPGDQMFTCGWMDRYDVYIHSRQHGQIHRWRNGNKALVIAEYGDWEYYAANEGFDQKTGAGVHAQWSNARKFRGDGERGMLQQALNHQIALNDTLSSKAALDGLWSMFDYSRGYHPVRAATGVMDVFRLPKFSYYFFQSQRGYEEIGSGWKVGPMVFIASHWTPSSDLRISVYSNCDEVELRLDGVTQGRQHPSRTWKSQHLPHPPFIFDLPRFSPGLLEAVGYVAGRAVCVHRVRTPALPVRLSLVADTMEIPPQGAELDVLIVHARLDDDDGHLCVDEGGDMTFSVVGTAALAGPVQVAVEAGIGSNVLRVSERARHDGYRVNVSWGTLTSELVVPPMAGLPRYAQKERHPMEDASREHRV